MSAGEPEVALRPAGQADQEFLSRVYASIRAGELAPLPWSEHQKQAFLAQQFHAQSADYAVNLADAAFDVVLVDGEPAGHMIVARRADERGVRVTIYVERFNRALRLNGRLGFETVHDTGVHLRMKRPPDGPGVA